MARCWICPKRTVPKCSLCEECGREAFDRMTKRLPPEKVKTLEEIYPDGIPEPKPEKPKKPEQLTLL